MRTVQTPAAARSAGAGRGAVIGIVAALVALGVAQLAAAALSAPLGEPVNAVGALSINHTPEAVKEFAITTFGPNDKTVLVWGIRLVLAALAVGLGIGAMRRLWLGLAGLGLLAVIGVYAAVIQPHTTAADALPSLVGAAVAALVLRYFRELASRGLARPAITSFQAAPATGPGWTPVDAAPAGTRWQPAGPEGDDEDTSPEADDTSPEADDGLPEVPDWTPARPLPEPGEPAAARQRAAPRPAPAVPAADRRRFLATSAAFAAGSLVAYGGGTLLTERRSVSTAAKAIKLPRATTPAPPLPAGADLKIPGLASFITPDSSFYRVDTALVLPEVNPAQWQLRIHGMVRREMTLNFEDVLKQPLIEDYITLCCVSNPVDGPYIGNAKWLGASLRSLLRQAGVQAGATQLLCTSSDGFTSGTPVATAMDGRDALLAVGMNGTPLPVAHGFPARLVIPGLYGYVSACKWIVDIEVTTFAAARAYWVTEGWSQQAPIKTESRIDVPAGSKPVTAGRTTTIAGVAWAQHKGIEAVEVRIGGSGPWHQATLAAVPDLDTWRQWAYEWHVPQSPGSYMIEARATDKTGYTQTAFQAPPPPNGASGYPSVTVTVAS